MVQILRRTPHKTTSDYFADAIAAYSEGSAKKEQSKRHGQALREAGIDPNLPPEMQKVALAESLKGKRQNERHAYINSLIGEGESGEKVQEPSMPIYQEDIDETEQPKKKSKGFRASDIPKEKRAQLAIEEPQTARVIEQMAKAEETEEREANKEKRRQFESDREFHSKRSDPIIEAAQNVIKESEITKGLAQQARRAVESGGVEGISPFLISKLGFEPGFTPDMSTFMSAQKHAFLGDLKGLAAGARPNQFLEKLLSSALPAIGRPKEANLDIMDMDDFIRDMKVERARIELRLADEDYKKLGFSKADIARRADEAMTKFAEEAQDKLAYGIRNRHVSNMSDDELAQEIASGKVGPDQPITQREMKFIYLKNGGDIKATNREIQKKGYKIPSESVYRGF